ncbi:MAG: M20/M25/M40 family metallo-hydrolase [Hungatella hathewayi]|nr:M20/M25/M40 family metallo-hydrolase [Hungatella hathewayi]
MKRQRESVDEMTGLDILRDLVSINTVNPPGNERAAAVYLKELLEPVGFLCTVQELGDGRANFIAKLGREDGVELIFNGHLDVVPAVGHWDTNPFELCESGDGKKVYGRGVCDMKGGVAAMCRAALAIARAGGPERGMLKLLFVADEEDANRGTRAYLRDIWDEEMGDGDEESYSEEHGRSKYGVPGKYGRPGKSAGCRPREVYAVIGEPTNLEVAVAHRGVARSYVDIRGAARHAALPEDGHSSIEKLPDVLRTISEVNRELGKRTHPVLPPPGISITMVDAYEKDNVVPGKVRLLTDFRILPDMGYGEAEEILRNALHGAGIEHVEIRNHFFMPGGEISPDDEFVTCCCEIAGRMEDRTSEPQAFDASCEQCFLMEAGMKAVILGPGSLEQAHTRNEFLEVEQLERAAVIYEEIAREILGGGAFGINRYVKKITTL